MLDIGRQHWALIAAGSVIALVLLLASAGIVARSARARLWAARRLALARRRDARRCHARTERARLRLERLARRAERVPPRRLEDARGAFDDARALEKIAMDKVLIADNHVRKIIVEDFPPTRHAAMRRRYLNETGEDKKPFTF